MSVIVFRDACAEEMADQLRAVPSEVSHSSSGFAVLSVRVYLWLHGRDSETAPLVRLMAHARTPDKWWRVSDDNRILADPLDTMAAARVLCNAIVVEQARKDVSHGPPYRLDTELMTEFVVDSDLIKDRWHELKDRRLFSNEKTVLEWRRERAAKQAEQRTAPPKTADNKRRTSDYRWTGERGIMVRSWIYERDLRGKLLRRKDDPFLAGEDGADT